MDKCDPGNATVYINWTLLSEVNYERAKDSGPVIAFLVILMVAGIFGNSLVIYIYSTKFRRTSTTYFILWLAVLDLVSCTLGLPFEISDVWNNAYFVNAPICKAARFLGTMVIMMSVLCLLVVAFDRYFKVCKPHRRPPFSSLKQVVAITAGITVLCSWPTLFTFGIETITVSIPNQTYLIQGSICSSDDNTSASIQRAYWLVLGLIFILSSVFMVTVYSLLVFSLRKREREMAEKRSSELAGQLAENTPGNPKMQTKIGRTSRLFIFITAIFILSFLPMLVLIVVETVSKFCELNLTTDILIKIFIRSQYINNVANPFLYGFYNPLFRRECKAIFFNKCLVYAKCYRYSVGDNVEDSLDCMEDQSSNALNSGAATANVKVKTRVKKMPSGLPVS